MRPQGRIRDIDIRQKLRDELVEGHRRDPEPTILVDEFGVCSGSARVDIVVINGTMSGYEIKSESDTLDRLAPQTELYSRILDYVTLVASPNHIPKAASYLPKWWGLIEARVNGPRLSLQVLRKPKLNPRPDAYSIAQLLWKDEVAEILRERSVAPQKARTRRQLWQLLVETLSLRELQTEVRRVLRRRQGWRSAAIRLSGDVSCQPSAKS